LAASGCTIYSIPHFSPNAKNGIKHCNWVSCPWAGDRGMVYCRAPCSSGRRGTMCDTIVALGDATLDGTVILAKNSDRQPNEAQVLAHVPGARHEAGATVRCTYISVPQVPETYEVLLSRPFWIWGCEMGVNALGVAIGNEAVFTREHWKSSSGSSKPTGRAATMPIPIPSTITTAFSSPIPTRPGCWRRRASIGWRTACAACGPSPMA